MAGQKRERNAGSDRSRRAVTLIKVAILIPVIGGFSAFGVEMTMLHALQSDAQRAADAGALAVAGWMARQPNLANLNFNTAFSIAQTTVDRNWVGAGNVTLAASDVVLGRASYDRQNKIYTWLGVGAGAPNAVEVTVRRTTGSPSGPVPLLFARIIGRSAADVSATAQAAIQSRGLTLVIDNSPAMNDDSQLSSEAALGDMVAGSPNGMMNLKQLWQSLGSPTYGNMTTWSDGVAGLQTLTGNAASIQTALGLDSVPYPASIDPASNRNWTDFISYVKGSQGSDIPASYRNKYGLRTFFDYLNSGVSPASFAIAPQQPLKTVKEVVNHLADRAEIRGDQMGLYNRSSDDPHFEVDLTTDMSAIRNRINGLYADKSGTTANIGAGINEANTALNSPHASVPDGQGYILVISDGSGQTGNPDPQIRGAVRDGYTVAALSVGNVSRPGTSANTLMESVGALGGGGHLHLPPNLGLTAADFLTIDNFISNLVGHSHVAVLIK